MKMPKIPGMGNLNQMLENAMKQAQQLEEDLAAQRFEISAGGGMVKAEFTGTGEMLNITISKEVVDPEDVEMLQDLIVGVVREGHKKASEMRQEMVGDMTGGMPNMPF